MMITLGKLLLGVLTAALLVVAIGATYQWQQSRADRAQFPPPGRIFEVDGLALHLDCRGSGKPTVVLEAGLNSGSSSWCFVHDAMARTTRVCAYDRPGIDWSEPTNRKVDAREVARRLNRLLETAQITGAKILVGMSAGGVYVREYYRHYPEEIDGMVLVDSSHEQQGARLPDLSDAFDLESILSTCAWLQPVGAVRASREMAATWNILQTELTNLSTRGQRVIATESGHVIQLDQPEIVINAVTGMALELRR